MPMPAARMGDQTAHGGVIVVGLPTVLIGGQPAARVGDMHTCPMVTGVVPHVGGPITGPGSPTVLIGGHARRAGERHVYLCWAARYDCQGLSDGPDRPVRIVGAV